MKLSRKAWVNIKTVKYLIQIVALFLIGKPKKAFHIWYFMRMYRLYNSMSNAEKLEIMAYLDRRINILENEQKLRKEKTV